MADVPGPCALHDAVDGLKFRHPAEFAFDLVGPGDEPRGVSGSARFFDDLDGLAGDAFARGDDFTDAGSAASAEIEKGALFHSEREHVCGREIKDVDVIANAGAVRRLVVGAVDFDVILLAEGDFEDVRDEVRLTN